MLVAHVSVSLVPLDNLRIIRGSQLYNSSYALAVLDNTQNGQGLRTLRLRSLTGQIFFIVELSIAQCLDWTRVGTVRLKSFKLLLCSFFPCRNLVGWSLYLGESPAVLPRPPEHHLEGHFGRAEHPCQDTSTAGSGPHM